MESKLLLFGLIAFPFAGIFMFLMLYGMAEGLNRTEDAKVFRKFLYFFCALFLGSIMALIAFIL